MWPEAEVVEQQKWFGLQFGHGVTRADIVAGPLLKFEERIVELKQVRMSMSTRIFEAKTWLASIFSYVSRFIVFDAETTRKIGVVLFDCVAPVLL